MRSATVIRAYPACSYCGREFRPGDSWNGSNYCKAAYLLPLIESNPGVSSWELAQLAGMGFPETTRAVQKARDWGLVEFEAEDRTNGGQRYRYTVKPEWKTAVDAWIERRYI